MVQYFDVLVMYIGSVKWYFFIDYIFLLILQVCACIKALYKLDLDMMFE